MDQANFLGLNGFVWWIGVVENRLDPLGLGRVQVRIFGHHTENKIHIPTEDLPWAQPIVPFDSTTKPPTESQWLFGFFIDGKSAQIPYYMGVIPGIPSPLSDNPQIGFTDPRTINQLKNAPQYYGKPQDRYPLYKGEPTTSRVYRNENVDTTVIGRINSSLTTGIPTADGNTWDQPQQAYAAIPPYDEVKETESGHLQEFDDTPNAERINIAHRTGTYTEMRPDGSKVTKVVSDNYEVIVGNDFVYVEGNCNLTAKGNLNLQSSGNLNVTINGNVDMKVNGTYTAKASSFTFDGPINTTSTITAAGDVIGGGISLDNHVHPYSSGGTTQKPE